MSRAGRRACFASIADLPEPPDHVGIVVPIDHVIPTLRACAARGVPFATLFTAGYGETGTERGRALQAELRAFTQETGLRVMGPNCNGMINFVTPFAMTSTATINGPRRPAGDIGVVAQSGGVGQVNVMWRSQEAGLGISYEVSSGNDADLDLLDFIDFMVEDDVTRVILGGARAHSRRRQAVPRRASGRRARQADPGGQARPHRGGCARRRVAYPGR
ncbi:MAG: CoA-binding protein [Pseudomonadota bacterium]